MKKAIFLVLALLMHAPLLALPNVYRVMIPFEKRPNIFVRVLLKELFEKSITIEDIKIQGKIEDFDVADNVVYFNYNTGTEEIKDIPLFRAKIKNEIADILLQEKAGKNKLLEHYQKSSSVQDVPIEALLEVGNLYGGIAVHSYKPKLVQGQQNYLERDRKERLKK